jgi:CRP/FNR family cyclic AMP-dependent transcriptional regulator
MKPSGSDTSAIVEMLQKAPLWSGLTEKELKVIARSFKELKYESGDIIVRKEETGSRLLSYSGRRVGFYLVMDGAVEVRKDGRVLSRLAPGQFFGEMSLLEGQARSADVVALEPSRCLALSVWDFKDIMSDHPNIAAKMRQESARRSHVNAQDLSG